MQSGLYVAEAILTLVGALYVLGPLMPGFFMDFLALGENKYLDGGLRRFWDGAKVMFFALSVGVFLYHAAKGLFHLIPGDWTTSNEDGDPIQSRVYITGLVALFGTGIVLSYTERRVRQLHELDQAAEAERRQRRGIKDE